MPRGSHLNATFRPIERLLQGRELGPVPNPGGLPPRLLELPCRRDRRDAPALLAKVSPSLLLVLTQAALLKRPRPSPGGA